MQSLYISGKRPAIQATDLIIIEITRKGERCEVPFRDGSLDSVHGRCCSSASYRFLSSKY